MNVLVTGGGGFLGKAICNQLLDRGHHVIAFQRSDCPGLAQRGAEVIQGDIADKKAVGSAMSNVDAVIHTAAKAGVSLRYKDYYLPNVRGTNNIIDACLKRQVSKLVFTSSPSVTHADGDVEGGDESLPYALTYHSPYPATKARSEQMVMAANGKALQTVSLRPHLVWGPGDNHLLPKLRERAKGGVLKLPGPEKLIDTVYIDNATEAHLLALEKLITQPHIVGGKTYFISNDQPVSQAKIITALLKASGLEVRIEAISPTVAKVAGGVIEAGWRVLRLRSDPPVTRWSAEQLSTAHWYDISAAKRDLGYQPKISIEEGLQRLRHSFNH